jgi:hypothetical protein
MDYQTIADYFLTPKGNEVPVEAPIATPARRLRDSLEAIATIGWWSRAAAEESLRLGHGFLDGYVWGRAAALGSDVVPAVVVSAFGVFSAELLIPTYTYGRSVCSADAILAARSAGASRGLAEAVTGVPLETITTCADQLLSAVSSLEPGPRHLFGALQAQPLPESPYGRLWRGAELVREHRGDSHLAACVAAGLDMAEMNVLTEVWLGYPVGEYSATRGFSPEQLSAACVRLQDRGWFTPANELSEQGRLAREGIESATDLAQQPLINALGANLEPVIRAADVVTAAILASHAAPADPRKRAAG